jgi:hypothetical protein
MHSNHSQKQGGALSFSMPSTIASVSTARNDNSNKDFIPHPVQFPLRYKRRPLLSWFNKKSAPATGDVGLSFHSEKYIPAGATLDLEIPLRGQVQRFTARVVMVREDPTGFEIGLWFSSVGDATRVRIVEQICRTECYLQERARSPT